MDFFSAHCLGQLYAGVGEPRTALAYYERALATGAVRDLTLFHHMGLALMALGRLDEASARLQQFIEHKPWAWWSRVALGQILLRQDNWSAAQVQLEEALRLNNANPWTHFHLFEARRVTLGWKTAMSMWLDTVLAAPQMPELPMRLGTLWVQGSSFEAEQVQKLAVLADRYPQSDEVNFVLALALGSDGQIGQATQRLKRYTQRAWEREYEQYVQPDAPVKLPEFLIFGNAKCGSTALYSYLVDHPLVCAAVVKEVCYWTRYFELGQDWYRACFMPIPVTAPHITGEGSITSLWHADAPQRVARFRADMKLILIIRDPVARAYSHYQMHRRLGYDQCGWEEQAEHVLNNYGHCPLEPEQLPALEQEENLLIHSAVLPYLKRWRQHFPAQQFLVLRTEELAADVQATVNTAYNFLGLPAHQLSSTARSNVGGYARMDLELERRLRQWFQPHEDALAEFLASDMSV